MTAQNELPHLFDDSEYTFHPKSKETVTQLAGIISPLPDAVCSELAEQSPLTVFRNVFSAIRPDPAVATDVPYYNAVSLQRDVLFGYWKGALLRYVESRGDENSIEHPAGYHDNFNNLEPSQYLSIKKRDDRFFTYTLHLNDKDGRASLQFYYNPSAKYIFLPDKEEPSIRYWGKHRQSGEDYEFRFNRNDLKQAKQTIQMPGVHAYRPVAVTTEISIPYFNLHSMNEGEAFLGIV